MTGADGSASPGGVAAADAAVVDVLAAPMNSVDIIAEAAKLAPDLFHLLEVKEVPLSIRAQLAKKKIRRMETFASMASTRRRCAPSCRTASASTRTTTTT